MKYTSYYQLKFLTYREHEHVRINSSSTYLSK